MSTKRPSGLRYGQGWSRTAQQEHTQYPRSVFESFGKFSKNTKMAIESSSVYKSVFFQLRDTMGFDVILSNPYTTKMIAKSKKKTDKIDARILADLNRGNYLVECYVPTHKAMQNRDLTRFRRTLVNAVGAATFSTLFICVPTWKEETERLRDAVQGSVRNLTGYENPPAYPYILDSKADNEWRAERVE